MLPATLAAATLAISGCAANNNLETAPTFNPGEITQTASQLPQGECSLHFVKPNAYLKDQKASALSKDLGVLSVIHSKDKKAKLGDIATASGIIRDSYRDPVYAQAITVANRRIKNGQTVTVRQLKAIKTDKLRFCEDKNHISKKDGRTQYHRTAATGQYLIRGLGAKYAQQSGTFAERLLDKAEAAFDEVKQQLDQATK